MNDIQTEILEKIYEICLSRGFVSEDDILNFASDAELSLIDINWLTEALLTRGVIIRDDTLRHNDVDKDEYDASRIDYDALFDEVIANAPELQSFIKFVGKIQPPQWKEWVKLVPQAKSGNRWAYNRLFEMNLRIVIKSALYFYKRYRISIADAIQDGCMGLMHAIEKFDPVEHNSFPAYITRPILTYIQRRADFVPLSLFYFPANVQNDLYKIFDLVEDHFCASCFCRNKYDCAKLIGDVATYLEYPLEKIKHYLRFFKEYDSNIDGISDNFAESYIDRAVKTETQRIINAILKKLPQKEELVLRLRFGFENDYPKRLEEIGTLLGVTRERVRQIEQKAISRLRHPVHFHKLLTLV